MKIFRVIYPSCYHIQTFLKKAEMHRQIVGFAKLISVQAKNSLYVCRRCAVSLVFINCHWFEKVDSVQPFLKLKFSHELIEELK